MEECGNDAVLWALLFHVLECVLHFTIDFGAERRAGRDVLEERRDHDVPTQTAVTEREWGYKASVGVQTTNWCSDDVDPSGIAPWPAFLHW